MKALFIGGIGTIGTAVATLVMDKEWGVTLLNRGSRPVPERMESMVADIHDETAAARIMEDRTYNTMTQFIAYGAEGMQHSVRLFQGKTKQYIFISSVSAYQKPAAGYPVTESTPLINPHWGYSRKKIDAEEVLTAAYRKNGFPVTAVRPSHTYDDERPPVAIHGHKGDWQILKRTLEGGPVIIPGDGTSLWILTHSADFTRGYMSLVGNPHAIGSAYHITNDESMTWGQIYETLAGALDGPLNALHVASGFPAEHGKECDFAGQLLEDKVCTILSGNTKIRRAVSDFVYTVSMAEGIRSSVRYMVDHPENQTPDPQFGAWCDRIAGAWRTADETFGK